MELTNRHKVTILFAEGMAEGLLPAYFMCVDMGEFAESESLRKWCSDEDKRMRVEDMSRNAWMADTGRKYT